MSKIISAIIVMVVTAAMAFVFVVPAFSKVAAVQALLVERQAEFLGKSAYYVKIQDLLAGIESRKEALEKIDTALPAQFSLAPILNFFQQQAANNGLAVKSVIFSQAAASAAAEQKMRSVTFSVDLMGKYEGLKNFLKELEKSSRIFKINTISFASSDPLLAQQQSANSTYSFKLEIETYSY